MTADHTHTRSRFTRAFTLLELLVVIVITSVLATLTFSIARAARSAATGAHCTNNLRQLGAAMNLYLADNNNFFPPYVAKGPNGGRQWYFGLETTPSGTPEGKRKLDPSKGPLYPYIQTVGSVEVCKGFDYGSTLWKPKFKGASYGYGYNWLLGGRLTGIPQSAAVLAGNNVIVFGDCGQVNTFQPPASAAKPMIEEFYILNETDKTVHFRHNGHANMLFMDGHVQSFAPYKGTEDRRSPGQLTGRITPTGSLQYLQ